MVQKGTLFGDVQVHSGDEARLCSTAATGDAERQEWVPGIPEQGQLAICATGPSVRPCLTSARRVTTESILHQGTRE